MDGCSVKPAVNVVLLGAPGSGKGTQARLLAERFCLTRVSTGEMLRAAVNTGSPAGDAAADIMQRGDLVPDAIVDEILANRLDQGDPDGVIFDGYPRTLAQAQSLDGVLAARRRSVTAAISLQVHHDSIAERICGRFTCNACGEGFHDRFKLPQDEGTCDSCGSSDLGRRADDTSGAVLARLLAYAKQAGPIEHYYESRGVLQRTDAMGQIGAVSKRLSVCVEEALT